MNTLTPDMELQNLNFLCLSSVFVWSSISSLFPFLPFGMVMYILCHYMLEVCELLFYFDFIEGYY